MDSVIVNSVALHIAETGAPASPDRPALVFVNSLGTDFRIWDGVVARLASRFRILRYDQRGHGLSDLGATDCRIEDHAGDLAALMDRRRISNAVVCGISVGGQIALALAARRPDLVRRLILSDTAQRIGTAESWNARIAAIEGEGLDSIADGLMERWFSPGYRAAHPAELAVWRNMLVRTPAAGYIATCIALREADLTAAARGLRVGTLCLCGAVDLSTPPDLVRGLAALIPGARYQEIAGAGHLPCIEDPDRFAALISAFTEETAFA